MREVPSLHRLVLKGLSGESICVESAEGERTSVSHRLAKLWHYSVAGCDAHMPALIACLWLLARRSTYQ